MIELLPSSASHVVAMRASGTLSNDDIQIAIDAIEAAKRAHPRVSLYAEIDDMRGMSPSALLRDIGYGLTQLGDLKHYYRAAVVTDQRWIARVTRLENRLFRPLEIRAFACHDSELAKVWVRHLPEVFEPGMDGQMP